MPNARRDAAAGATGAMPDPTDKDKDAEKAGDAEPTDDAAKDETTDADDESNQDAGKLKEALRKEREARRAEEKRRKELEAERAKADAEKAKAEEAEAVKRGEFEKIAEDRAEKIAALTGERDDIRRKYEGAIALVTPGADAAWKDLPAEVRAMYGGADDDVLARFSFATAETTKKLVEKLGGAPPSRKNGPDPRPSGPPRGGDDEEARRRNASRYAQ